MMVKYKKGQIVPRYLVRCKRRKTQHLVKFGSDVEVCGREVRATSGAPLFFIDRHFVGGKNGKPRLYLISHFKDIAGIVFNDSSYFIVSRGGALDAVLDRVLLEINKEGE